MPRIGSAVHLVWLATAWQTEVIVVRIGGDKGEDLTGGLVQ